MAAAAASAAGLGGWRLFFPLLALAEVARSGDAGPRRVRGRRRHLEQRRAPRNLDAALAQVCDIESVGRQALTEIREAVTGYREGSLATELAGARSVLDAAGIESLVRRTGSPLAPQTEALLGWVVREAVTNVVRHSGATRCVIAVDSSPERVHVKITDDGRGVGSEQAADRVGGTGLRGLTERIAAAGGTLDAGPSTRGGFLVSAELPVGADLELESTP